MNTRRYVELDKEQNKDICFIELPKEHEILFRSYIEESRHLQEITQLYQMMLFGLDEIFLHYQLNFNDTVVPIGGKYIDVIQLNALLGNAVSAARTLVESMVIYDKAYISKEELFKTNYISRTYDEYFTYRFVDFLRNYMQHGHVPVSFDGERIYFQLSEILDVSHMKINANLKIWLKDIEKELIEYGAMDTRLAVVPTLYQYFLLIHTLVLEFFRLVKIYRFEHFREINKVLSEHPEYIVDIEGQKHVGVYLDGTNIMHGFLVPDNMEQDIETWIETAQLRLQQYRQNNGNLFFLQIEYCLEYRMPVIRTVDDDDLSKNLEQFCLESGTDIRYLSFDDYYGKAMMHSVYHLYPFIQFENGVRWNVPYQEVTIADFLRTFPGVKEKGLKIYANNVGGAEDLLQTFMQDWSGYLDQAKVILNNVGIHSPIDVLDWASRITFVWQGIKQLKKSFSKVKKNKPSIKQLRFYISQRKEWNIVELAENLHADKELLKIVLQESGYVYQGAESYRYDEQISAKLEGERQQYLAKLYDCHGSNVNCYSMNKEVERINVNLLYFAVLKMEQGKLEDFDLEVQEILLPLKSCEQFLYWDDYSRCIRIREVLPAGFSEEDECCIREHLIEVDAALENVIV